MSTVVENMTATNERVIEGVKKAQTQLIEMNERAAGMITKRLGERTPRVDMSFASKAANGYFDFVGEMLTAQRDFTARLIDVWTPEQVEADEDVAEEAAEAKKSSKK